MAQAYSKEKVDPHFMSLIFSLSQAAMMQLGKVANPATNKIERDIEAAKVSIDMLRMLRDKTKGNLTADEERFVTGLVADLELNFADEVKKTVTSDAGQTGGQTSDK